jgi:signal transduction histidine kinase/ligand-binding sensor domain-containing protein/DNA-binding response OmpR family regulator
MCKKFNRIILILSCSIAFLIQLHAQDNSLKFQRISIEKGLSHSVVTSIFQDKKGFMWFGTGNGLNKYDGYNFTIYKQEAGNPSSITQNNITAIYEDHSGNLWVGTSSNGLNRYNRDNDNFYNCQNSPTFFRNLCNKSINCIFEDKENNLWIGTNRGLFFTNRLNGSFFQLEIKSNGLDILNETSINSIVEDKNGILWIGTSGKGLLGFNKKNNYITFNSMQSGTVHAANITSLLYDKRGKLWIGTYNNGLYVSTPEKNILQNVTRYQYTPGNRNSISNDHITSIFEDENNMIWIGSENGFDRYDIHSGQISQFQYDANDPNSLSNNNISTIYEDRSHILWVGTVKGGLNKYDQVKKKFIHYRSIPNNSNSLSDNVVYSIFEDHSGLLWIGTRNGNVDIFDRKREQFYHLGKTNGLKNELEGKTISSICEDNNHKIWLGTYSDGVYQLSSQGDEYRNKPLKIKHIDNRVDSTGIYGNLIRTIAKDTAGNIWIGTADEGLTKFDWLDKKYSHFQYNIIYPKSVSSNSIGALFFDKTNNLWIGTNDAGLSKLNDVRTNEFLSFKNNPDPGSLVNNAVRAIYEDAKGYLWLGTEGGLAQTILKYGVPEKFINITEKEGLANNTVYGILEDSSSNLWISTDNGLSKYNPAKKKFISYNLSDGLQSNEFNLGAYFKCKDGEMFFGGINGITAFFPDSIIDNPYKPSVVITGFKIFNEQVPVGKAANNLAILNRVISETDTITISYSENVFSFEFVALHYASPDKIRYAYKMDGFDKKWIFTDSRNRIATYTNLPSGEYVFHVKASNNDDVWNETGASIRIFITPPFWKTWWAYLFYLILVFIGLYVVYNYIEAKNKRRTHLEMERLESRKLHEMDQMKLRFFSNISHEFRTPLTLILGPLEKLLSANAEDKPINQKVQFQLMYRSAKRLLRLINQLLDFHKLETGNMQLRASEGDVIKFIKGIMASFTSFAEKSKIRFTFASNNDSIKLWFDADKLEKIVYNLLSNAFKFTPENGHISITVNYIADAEKDKEFVEISVKDTGIGIPAKDIPNIFRRFYQAENSQSQKQESSGIGLALTKDLVDLHKGEILAISEPNKGAQFIVKLPIGNAHLKEDEIIKGFIEHESDQMDIYTPDPEIQEDKRSKEGAKNKELILLVEDNADLRAYMNDNLSDRFRLIEAVDGQDGWQKALEHFPDLIISDVMMPVMDGLELCNKLKSDEKTSHIPVILLTARSSDDFMIQGLKTGADDYISKPFNLNVLLARIDNIIESRKKLRDRFNTELRIEPRDITITTTDEKFLQKAMDVVEANLSNPEFDVEVFGSQMGVSRMQLYRKLMALTSQSGNQFIRTMRLKRAAQIMEKDSLSVTEVMYKVGFNNRSYFTSCFQEQFGIAPKDFAAQNKNKNT